MGKGLIEIDQLGTTDLYNRKFDETISYGRPKIIARNIIFGGLALDTGGDIIAVNHRTGDTGVLKMIPQQSSSVLSRVEGQIRDPNGKV